MKATKFLNYLLLPTIGLTSVGTLGFAIKAKTYKSENSRYRIQTNRDLDFSSNVINSVNYQEIVYWHDDEPEAQVTKVNTHPVNFNITSNNIIADINNRNIANSKNATAAVEQVTAFQTTGNSGSYQFDDKKEEHNRIVDWQRILGDYISYRVVPSTYTWGDGYTKCLIDVIKTWSPNNSINNVEGKIVYINDEVYDNKNHDFWFSRGISKDMKNLDYHVWAIPYAYAKEIQYIYGVYNFVARYLYTLQANANFKHTTFDIGIDNEIELYNNLSYLYDLSNLVCIKKINYPSKEYQPVELVWGFNDEILELYQSTLAFDQNAFLTKISKFSDYGDYDINIKKYIAQGKININTLPYLNSKTSCYEIFKACRTSTTITNDWLYKLFSKYNFKQSDETLKTLNLLFKCINLKINTTVFDPTSHDYINQTHTFSADNLNNNNAKMLVYLDDNHEYWFRVNSIASEASKEHNAYIADATVNYADDHSADGIDKNNDHYIIKQPEFPVVHFNEIPIEEKDKAPSEVTKEELINKYFVFENADGSIAEVQPPQYYHINLEPDDIEGTLTVTAILTDNKTETFVIEDYKKFEYQDILDVSANAFSIVLSNDISDDKIWQILLSQGWISQVREKYRIIEKDPDLRNGILKFRLRYKDDENSEEKVYKLLDYKQITISSFEQYYVDFVEDEEYLSTHNAKDVSEEDVRLNLVKTSDGYKNTHTGKYCYIDKCDKENNKLVVKVKFEDDYEYHTFYFTGSEPSNKTVLIICLSVISVGILALALTLIIHFTRAKKKGGIDGKNNLNQQEN